MSQIGVWTAKFLSIASRSALWCQWWNAGVTTNRLQRAELPPDVGVNERGLRRDEKRRNHQRRDSEKPSTKIGTYVRPRVTITSTRCSRDPASQSISSIEW